MSKIDKRQDARKMQSSKNSKKAAPNQKENQNKQQMTFEDYEDFEDFEELEDFEAFVKATGWKGKSSSSSIRQKAAAHKAAEKKTSGHKSAEQKAIGHKSAEQKVVGHKTTEQRFSGYNNAEQKVVAHKTTEHKVSGNKAAGYMDAKQKENSAAMKKLSQIQKRCNEKQIGYMSDRKVSTDVVKSNQKFSTGKESFKGKKVHEKSNFTQGTKPASQIKGTCSYQKECGGCNIRNQSYELHLTEKQRQVETLLKKFCKVEPIIRMDQPEHYRYKVHVVFDHDRKGTPISGVYEEGTHRVIPVERCLIHNEKADEIIRTIRGMLKSFKIMTYDEDTGYGLLRHVLIRSGYHSGEIMVVLVLGSPIMPSKNNFVKALRKEHPEITTVVVNVNDKKTSMVLGEKEQVIYGKGFIEDSLCGKTFRISPKSFYQVNPEQTEHLYNKAIELAQLKGTETVVDAYCGIGTIGLIAADHVGKVIGVELNKDAVRDALINARRNNTENIQFYHNDAGVFLSQMASADEKVDVVFLDPPRSGSTTQFLDAVAQIKPTKVVYISCNPVTLQRDLDYLTKKGYKAQVAVPVDMFPWTEHVECVTLMSRVEK